MEEAEGDYSDHHHQYPHHLLRPRRSPNRDNNSMQEMADYVLHQQPPPPDPDHHPLPPQTSHLSLDKLSFADVMQFADFGPKLALSGQPRGGAAPSDDVDVDDNYFLKFSVLGGGGGRHALHDVDDLVHVMEPQQSSSSSLPLPHAPNLQPGAGAAAAAALDHHEGAAGGAAEEAAAGGRGQREESILGVDAAARAGGTSEKMISSSTVQQLQQPQLHHRGSMFVDVVDRMISKRADPAESKSRSRKRPRSMKTSEEVEMQRMTHIAVERNRRKQMNEHLRVLRSLMPGSYVQRGDQASIIGGAIEFVRELEQLLQCLESQKRRRMFGGEALSRTLPAAAADPQQPPFFPQPPAPAPALPPPPPPALFPGGGGDQQLVAPKLLDHYDVDTAAHVALQGEEEAAESKSCLADVEVKLLGLDAMIKILSRRRPGQLLKTIAALEEMPLHILHTNITTIEQTVLYSFNVKIAGEPRFSAEDIANSVQQIFSFIDASTV